MIESSAGGMRLLLIVLAKNEELQLKQTVHGLQAACSPETVAGITLLLAHNATDGCLRVATELSESAGQPLPVVLVKQPTSDLPACIRTVLDDRQDITHVMFLGADYFLESAAIADLVAHAAQDTGSVYKFSRTLPGGAFASHYKPFLIPLYRLFCVFTRMLFGRGASDPAFGHGAIPVHILRGIRYNQTSHMLVVEQMLTLRRLKIPIVEIPAVQLPRTEHKNSSNLRQRLLYIVAVLRIRFAPLGWIWRDE